jgi:AcrR family transcriptional regulator
MQVPEGLDSRERILWAAATMLGEDAGSALSVRAVAARAGVSTGSLRHHFPRQSDLMDAVLGRVYDLVLRDDAIGDTTKSPRERLLASLQRLLVPEGPAIDVPAGWLMALDRYAKPDATPEAKEEFLGIERELRRRVEGALALLQGEGVLPPGDNERRARFLMTVVNGISISQAFPAPGTRLRNELDVLRVAVDSVFETRI